MNKLPTARDCMSNWFVTLRPEQDLTEGLDLLVSKRASGAPVVDESGAFVGVLTEKDCLRVMSNRALGEHAYGKVGEFMSTVKMVVDVDMDIFRVAELFLETHVPVLPVMDGDTLVGRISRQDMLLAVQKLTKSMAIDRKRDVERLRVNTDPRSIEDFQKVAGSNKPEHIAGLFSNRDR
jgi:predicted transcriptional regulator